MRRGEIYKFHKQAVRELRDINDYFNSSGALYPGRYFVSLVSEQYLYYNDEFDSSPHPLKGIFYICAHDRVNPLNNCIFISKVVYYTIKSERIFDILDGIWGFLNSWVQFTEYGRVLDSPPHCNPGDNKYSCLDRFISPRRYNDFKNIVLCNDDKEYINNCFKTIDVNNSKVILEYDEYKLNIEPSYTFQNYSVIYKPVIIFNDINNNYLFSLIKNKDTWYVGIFKRINSSRNWEVKCLYTYPINMSLSDFIKDDTLRCWMLLSGIQSLE